MNKKKQLINRFFTRGYHLGVGISFIIWTLVCLFLFAGQVVQGTYDLYTQSNNLFNEIMNTTEQYEQFLTKSEQSANEALYQEALRNHSKYDRLANTQLSQATRPPVSPTQTNDFSWVSPVTVLYGYAPTQSVQMKQYSLLTTHFTDFYNDYWGHSGIKAPQTYLLLKNNQHKKIEVKQDSASDNLTRTRNKLYQIENQARALKGSSLNTPVWVNMNKASAQPEIWAYLPWNWEQDNLAAGFFVHMSLQEFYYEGENAAILQYNWWLTSAQSQLLASSGGTAPAWLTHNTSGMQKFTQEGLYFQFKGANSWKMQYLLPYSALWKLQPISLFGTGIAYVIGLLIIAFVSQFIKKKYIIPIAAQGLALIDSEIFSRTLISQAPIGLCVLEMQTGKIMHINQAALDLLGEDSPAPDLSWLLDYAHENRQLELNSPNNNKKLMIHFSQTRLHGTNVWLCGLNDISIQKQVQTLLARAKRAADKANEAKSNFLAMTSHEIRTPLFGLVGTLELLAKSDLSPEQKELITLMSHSAHALNIQIDDVLDYAKIEAGALSLNPAPFSPFIQLQRMVDVFAAQANQKGLNLTTYLDPAIPPLLKGDTVRIEQILSNLISNSIKFTDTGKIAVTWYLQSQDQNLIHSELSVIDTGIGIAPEDIKNVFVPFAQMHQNVARYGGTGLGLPISQQLAKLMGSEIIVHSTQGIGSRFTFSLTLAIQAYQIEQETLAANIKSIDQPFRSLAILLVEDNLINQKILTKQLNSLGAEVTVANDGKNALVLVQSSTFDLVITDINMPKMGGVELVKTLKSQGFTQKIIALSAQNNEDEKALCLKAGFDDYLSKPINLQQLKDLIKHQNHNAINQLQSRFKKMSLEMQQVMQKSLQDDLSQLEDVIDKQDATQIKYMAHRLKGAFAVTALNTLELYCIEIEQSLDKNDFIHLKNQFNLLKQQTYLLWSNR